MRVLIFTLLAVAASAANYGYDNYYGGYPSYSYSSYPSSYYGGYGSSLYGAGYGSGTSYGLGGSGWTGGHSSYTTAYKPAVYQTSRYSYRQPHGTEAVYKSGYSPTDAPGKVEFILGDTGYQTGTLVLADHNKPELPKRSGVHAGSLHKTGVQDVSQILLHEKAGASGDDFTSVGFGGISSQAALPKPITGSQGFKAVPKSGTHTLGSRGPQISFVRETAKVTGSRPQIHTYDKVISAPHGAAVLAKTPTRSFPGSGPISRTGAHGHIIFTQDFSKVPGHSAGKAEIHGFNQVPAPLTSPLSPRIPSRAVGTTGTIHKSEADGITGDQPRISFTRDFSKVGGRTDTKPEIHSTDRISSPGVEAVAQPESAHDVGSQHKSESHGISDAGEKDFTQDVSGVSGLGTSQVKPSAVSSGRLTTSGVSALPRPSSGSVHRAGSVHGSGTHGISSADGPQITFIQGTSALRQSEIKTSSFDKISAPVVSRRPSYGSRVTGVQPNIPAPAFPAAAGPSRITFTQDFSRVSGHQTTGVKPVISTDDRLVAPIIPVVASQGYQGAQRNIVRFTSPIAAKPVQRPAVEGFRASKQPSFTAVYDQARTHGILPVRSDGLVTADKSIFAAGFADGHIANVEEQDGLKLSNFVVVPEAGAGHGKSSAFEHSTVGSAAGDKVSGVRHSVVGTRDHSQLVVPSYGVSSAGEAVDRSNVFVAIPAENYGQDKSSGLLHSGGVFQVGSLVEEKGSAFKLSSGEVDSVLSKQGQSQGYSITTTPFKSYYSSSYPGYSHVSGESPRFDFSPDRSLLYTYNAPYLVSPFSYSYTSGSKYYNGGSRKTIA